MQYIKGTVDRSIESGSMKALWFASFLAVYREGAETVLFYQAWRLMRVTRLAFLPSSPASCLAACCLVFCT